MVCEQALTTSEHRLAARSNAVTALTERSAEGTERFDDRLNEILRMAADTLQVERVSLWRMSDTHEDIRWVRTFIRTCGFFESGARIERESCPPYFDALETERVIAADDAQRDRRTRCFTES